MALVCNVFEMLYQLANLDESRYKHIFICRLFCKFYSIMIVFFITSRITLRVRNLLLLIPTDPEVQDALDNFVPKESSVWSHQVHQKTKLVT